jgi:hypothetical protein
LGIEVGIIAALDQPAVLIALGMSVPRVFGCAEWAVGSVTSVAPWVLTLPSPVTPSPCHPFTPPGALLACEYGEKGKERRDPNGFVYGCVWLLVLVCGFGWRPAAKAAGVLANAFAAACAFASSHRGAERTHKGSATGVFGVRSGVGGWGGGGDEPIRTP